MANNDKLLKERVVELSEATNWNLANTEWVLYDLYKEENGTCLCSKYPITKQCILVNHFNNNKITVGSSCVNKFFNINTEKYFKNIMEVEQDETVYMMPEILELLHKKKLINGWQLDFYLDIMKYKRLSEKQLIHKKKIDYIMIKNCLMVEQDELINFR